MGQGGYRGKGDREGIERNGTGRVLREIRQGVYREKWDRESIEGDGTGRLSREMGQGGYRGKRGQGGY